MTNISWNFVVNPSSHQGEIRKTNLKQLNWPWQLLPTMQGQIVFVVANLRSAENNPVSLSLIHPVVSEECTTKGFQEQFLKIWAKSITQKSLHNVKKDRVSH